MNTWPPESFSNFSKTSALKTPERAMMRAPPILSSTMNRFCHMSSEGNACATSLGTWYLEASM